MTKEGGRNAACSAGFDPGTAPEDGLIVVPAVAGSNPGPLPLRGKHRSTLAR